MSFQYRLVEAVLEQGRTRTQSLGGDPPVQYSLDVRSQLLKQTLNWETIELAAIVRLASQTSHILPLSVQTHVQRKPIKGNARAYVRCASHVGTPFGIQSTRCTR